jgi:long-chain-acyl-CoA dehydrogenase
MVTTTRAARSYLDDLLARHCRGELSAADAAAAKFWAAEQYVDIVGRCVQLHGAYGYMLEYRIAHDYLDSRISTIYGGTTEIMKEIVARDLGL